MRVVGRNIYLSSLKESCRPEIGDTFLGLVDMICGRALLQKGGRRGSRWKADRCMYLLEGGTEPRLNCHEDGEDDGWEDGEHFWSGNEGLAQNHDV